MIRSLLPTGLIFIAAFIVTVIASSIAHIYYMPRVEFERLEAGFLENFEANGDWSHGRELVGPDFTAVVRPNNDTLYSSTFINLEDGPLILTVPETGARYYSVQFLDPMTEVYAVVSRRTHGGGGGTYAILPPGYSGDAPDTDDVIEAPDNRAWVLVRFLIDGEHDLAAVHTLQDQLSLEYAED